MVMKNQVLTIDQMKELEALGIDTLKASMCYYPDNDSDFPDDPIYLLTSSENIGLCYPGRKAAFTLQDILKLLPEKINDIYPLKPQIYKGNIINFGYFKGSISGWFIFFQNANTIDSAFELLKWCKINKYI